MLRNICFLFITIIASSLSAKAQSLASVDRAVADLDLQVTFAKTSSVIFPWHIQSVDLGSRDVLAQKAWGVENVLQVKAGRRNMPSTNLTVITVDGTVYHFTVRYAASPDRLTHQLNKQGPDTPSIVFHNATAAQFERDAANILRHSGYTYVKGKQNEGITLSIEGIYVRNNQLYYHLHIDNASALNYDVDQLNFYVRDNRQVKRTAFQEVALRSIFQTANLKTIKAYAHEDIVLCMDKFTLANDRYLAVEMSEKKGGRNLLIKLKNRHLLKAKSLSLLD